MVFELWVLPVILDVLHHVLAMFGWPRLWIHILGEGIQVIQVSVHRHSSGVWSRYTGNSPDTPSMVVLLGALDLAHRWQVPHIVAMAENELVAMATWTALSEFL